VIGTKIYVWKFQMKENESDLHIKGRKWVLMHLDSQEDRIVHKTYGKEGNSGLITRNTSKSKPDANSNSGSAVGKIRLLVTGQTASSVKARR